MEKLCFRAACIEGCGNEMSTKERDMFNMLKDLSLSPHKDAKLDKKLSSTAFYSYQCKDLRSSGNDSNL